MYVVGWEHISGKDVATLWINGKATYLTNGNKNATAQSLFVLGNDVYVTGYEANDSGTGIIKVWKNGEAISLTDGVFEAYATDIFVTTN